MNRLLALLFTAAQVSFPALAEPPATPRPMLASAVAEAGPEADSARTSRTPPAQAGIGFKDCPLCPEMVVLPPGQFLMGAAGDTDARPIHPVRIPYFLAVGKYEVTFEEWEACVEAGGCLHNPTDSGWGRGRRPVIDISWFHAQNYTRWLSLHTGERYRLLSEAEWEYAARAGQTFPFPAGLSLTREHANFGKAQCCGGLAEGPDRWEQTAPVGSFPPNGFGLHDFHGNVSEWVEDCWHESYAGAPADGSPWIEGGNCAARVLRGGAWVDPVEALSASYRDRVTAEYRLVVNGFRVAKELGKTMRSRLD